MIMTVNSTAYLVCEQRDLAQVKASMALPEEASVYRADLCAG